MKQRRLKDESRWKFNPNDSYESDEDDLMEDEDWSYDRDYEERR